jgi:hypothetical protein
MSHKVPLVRVLTAATGNSTPITLGAAYSQLFMLPSEAGAMDGRTYTYNIVDGNNWEIGRGVYTASGTTLARTTILASRISGTLGTSRISLSGTAQVRFIESAEDMDGVRGTRPVTGTTDTLNNGDLGYVVTYSNAAAVAVSLAQASVSNLFTDGWAAWTQNLGAGTVTITPATSTINGAATLVLAQNMGAFIWSDGTNYHAYFIPVTKPLLAANNLSDLSAKYTALDNIKIHGADIASASTVNLETATGDLIDVTGTTTITAITLSEGHERTVRFTGALALTNGASLLLPGAANIATAAGDFAVFRGYASGVVRCVDYTKASGKPVVMPTIADIAPGAISAFLGADVLMNNSSLFFDGPSVAQGSSGTWSVTGTVTLTDTVSTSAINVKLWDGTTVIASAKATVPIVGVPMSVSLSGVKSAPAGNLRISCQTVGSTTGKILFNASGVGGDGSITAVRIG